MNATEDRTGTTPREPRKPQASSAQGITDGSPHVWVGCLACYNAGHLVGEWFDASEAPQDMDEWDLPGAWRRMVEDVFVRCEVAVRHASEDHEELWCFDHENFHGLLKGECSPATAAELAEQLESAREPAAFAAYVSAGYDAEDFAEAYQGEWDSEQSFAQNLAEELGAVPSDYSWPTSCIDWEQATRELFLDYWSERSPNGGVYVFRSV